MAPSSAGPPPLCSAPRRQHPWRPWCEGEAVRRLAGLRVLRGGLQALGHVLSIPSPRLLRLAEPHPQNTPPASAPPQGTPKILGLLLLEQFPPSRACAGSGVCASWGSLHPEPPYRGTRSPRQRCAGSHVLGAALSKYLRSLSGGD